MGSRRVVVLKGDVGLLEGLILLPGGFLADELKVSELIYAKAALRLRTPKKKVLKCLEATTIVIAWALTEGKDFDVVFKNLGILVCRGKTVIMRFFEDLLQDVDKTGVLVNNFLQVSFSCSQCSL